MHGEVIPVRERVKDLGQAMTALGRQLREAALRGALIALLTTALYYRFARHNATTFYLLFGGWIVIVAIFVFRIRKTLKVPE
jgi:hypothetical protein